MANDDPLVAIEGSALLYGYSKEYFSKADIERWAERKIEQIDEPYTALLDLAMLRQVDPLDVMSLLRSLSSKQQPRDVLEMNIGFIGLLYLAGEISAETAISWLSPMIYDVEITDNESRDIAWLETRWFFDEVPSRKPDDVEQVKHELASFFEPLTQCLFRKHPNLLSAIGANKLSISGGK